MSTRAGEVDVEVVVHDPAATVADLAAALPGNALRTADGLVVDGRPRSGSAGLAEIALRPGGAVGAVATPDRPTEPDPVVELLVIGGLAAGERHPLPAGTASVGRDPGCDLVLRARTASRRHLTVAVTPTGTVRVVDEGSASGTWVDGGRVEDADLGPADGVIAAGAVLLRLRRPSRPVPAILGRAGSDGRLAFHRPPRPSLPPAAAPVTPPSSEPPPSGPPRFGWAAALVPLAGGLVLAWLVDPRLALFTLLGPAVLVGQWVEERRRHRRAGTASRRTEHEQLVAFARDLEAAGAAEAHRRRATHPDPATLGEEIEAWGAGLWASRTGDPDFALVLVGSAPAQRWEPATTRVGEGVAAGAVAESRLPPACPALLALGPGRHLGVAGPRDACLAVARWVVLQLAARHGPADLRLAVACAQGREADWAWAPFLPHTTAPGSPGRRLLAAGGEQADDVAGLVGQANAVHVVAVVDGQDEVGPSSAAMAGGGWSTLTIAPSRRALPSRCTSVLELDGPDGWGHLADGGQPEPLLVTGVSAATARRWARRLAGLADPEADDDDTSVPTSVRLLDLLDAGDLDETQVGRRWAASGPGLVVPIGCAAGGDGPETVHLDLMADGPHALVAGTTGAGKSELLRSVVAALAATYPPDRLALLLVDFKGGAAFAEASGLPHVVGVVTDLGPDEAARALRSLEAELRRRERVLADLGLRDLAAHPGHAGGPVPAGVEPLPRVVVVIDELAALVAELPSFLDDLVQLAARGRSLGLHLVLGTQRPGGVVSASVRANCTLRCCLRVPDESDAIDVVGSVAPARIDRRRPGRAFLRRGAGDLVEVQVALVGGGRGPGGPPVSAVPATFGPEPAAPELPSSADESDLAALVEACGAAADRAGLCRPRALWLPPLPALVDGSTLPAVGDDVVLGLIDDPDHQRRLPLTWSPARGPLVAVGSGASPATALRAAAQALAARHDSAHLHVYGLDLAGQSLEPLEDLPHLGALIRPGDDERLRRLLQRLSDELAARQATATATADRPLILVLIDGVAGLRAALDDRAGLAAFEALGRVVADGAALGMLVAVAADRSASLPAAWSAAASRRLAFRCGDPFDLLSLGADRLDQSRWPEGRCLDLTSGLVAQVATGPWPSPISEGERPPPVRALPAEAELDPLLAAHPARAGGDGLELPLGVDGRDLGVAVVRLRPGQPFFVCGPPGSGRTTALATLRRAAEAAGCPVAEAGAGLAERLGGPPTAAPLVVVVDDADRVDDLDGALAQLATGRHATAHVLAALPADAGRAAFGHWTGELRRVGAGLVLRPRSDLDGDVLGIALLPTWPMSLARPGRGVLAVGGQAVPVQVAGS